MGRPHEKGNETAPIEIHNAQVFYDEREESASKFMAFHLAVGAEI